MNKENYQLGNAKLISISFIKIVQSGSSAEVLENIYPNRSDFSHLQRIASGQKEVKQKQVQIDSILSNRHSQETEPVLDSYACFKELVLMLILCGSSYSIIDNDYFRQWCQKYMKNLWCSSWNRKQGSIILNSASERLKSSIKQLFVTHEKYMNSYVLPLKIFENSELEKHIKMFFNNQITAEIP